MVTWAGDSQTRPAPPSQPSPRTTLGPKMIGVSMVGRYYRLMIGKWSCFRERAADPARFQVLALLVLGRRLLIHTGSTVPAIAQDGPSTERCRGTHPCELLPSWYRAQASDHAQVRVLSVLVPGRRLMVHTGSTVPAIAQDGPSTERGRGKHPDELLRSSGAALQLSVPGAGK